MLIIFNVDVVTTRCDSVIDIKVSMFILSIRVDIKSFLSVG